MGTGVSPKRIATKNVIVLETTSIVYPKQQSMSTTFSKNPKKNNRRVNHSSIIKIFYYAFSSFAKSLIVCNTSLNACISSTVCCAALTPCADEVVIP